MRGFVILLTLVLPACGAVTGGGRDELTRDTAHDILLKDKEFANSMTPWLVELDTALAAQQGLVRFEEVKWLYAGRYPMTYKDVYLTPLGKQYFLACSKKDEIICAARGPVDPPAKVAVELAPGFEENLTITGITGGPDQNQKEVLFEYERSPKLENYRRKNSPITPRKPVKARAYLRLYDDGWRVERISSERSLPF